MYENVQVLKDLSDDQFNQFMASITEWVAPEAGCNYTATIRRTWRQTKSTRRSSPAA
ncbi:photosynthetic reaction center cytochrome c subunit family protein [Rhizobium sp. G21]|uniref:photosynthetic reaction center cytochrome c subunit family protein n=1 Tax=Rhizobium sp. G21 TaxID=2758439 RepID=UPI0028AC96C5|nr:photosynthetic reaction center cytochrome c subunit family protein [Rhizobium sp. G21]